MSHNIQSDEATEEVASLNSKPKRMRKPAAPRRAPVTNDDALVQLVGLVSTLTKKVDTLADRLASVESGTPKFQRMSSSITEADILDEFDDADDTDPLFEMSKQAEANTPRDGNAHGGLRGRLPVTGTGALIPREIMRQLEPKFKPGDRVRINPEVKITETLTWGQALADEGIKGVGVVRFKNYLSDKGRGWKYQVTIPKLAGTGPTSSTGFWEDELLPLGRTG